jgi:SPP1 gp7 family putative phage head morphogenesis protein
VKDLTEQTEKYYDELATTAGVFAGLEAFGMRKVLDTAVKAVNKAAAFKAAVDLPMSTGGQLLKNFVFNIIPAEANRLVGSLRMGVTQGKTNKELVKDLIGTRKLNRRDGTLLTSKRNVQAVTTTATQHAASAARMRVWEKNADIVKGYQWVSVLDKRTSSTCRSLDGQKFLINKGPIPPIHMRCRSTIYALVSGQGQPDADQDYYTWLKGRNAPFQDSILGPTRGKLLRDGGLTATAFAELNLDKSFKPMTLDNMRKQNPEAFEMAGL